MIFLCVRGAFFVPIFQDYYHYVPTQNAKAFTKNKSRKGLDRRQIKTLTRQGICNYNTAETILSKKSTMLSQT